MQSVTSLKLLDKFWVLRSVRKRRSRRLLQRVSDLRSVLISARAYPELLLDRMWYGRVRRLIWSQAK